MANTGMMLAIRGRENRCEPALAVALQLRVMRAQLLDRFCRPRPLSKAAPHRRARTLAAACGQRSTSQQQHQSTQSQPHTQKGPSFKAALDFRFMKDNLALVETNTRQRLSSADPAAVVALYDQYLALKRDVEAVQQQRNENSAAMKVSKTCMQAPPGTMLWASWACRISACAVSTNRFLWLQSGRKLDGSARAALVEAGQKLKMQLVALDEKLAEVGNM